MKEVIIQLLTAVLGTLGFSILFYIRPRRLPLSMLGGLLAILVYLLLHRWLGGEFIPNLAGAFVGAVFSEITARLTRVPVTVYLTPSIVPLVPGYALYRTMSSLVRGDYAGFASVGVEMLSAALGIAGGIVACSVLFLLFRGRGRGKRRRTSP